MAVEQSGGGTSLRATVYGMGLGALLWMVAPTATLAQCHERTSWGESADSLVAKAKSQRRKGGMERLNAIKTLKCALEQAAQEKPAHDTFFPENYYRLGYYYNELGFNPEALQAYLHCYDLMRVRTPLPETDRQKFTDLLNAIAVQYSRLAQFDKAYAYILQAVDSAEVYYGEKDIQTQAILNNAAAVLTNIGQYQAADSLARRALQLARGFKKGDPRATARALINLSDNFQQQRKVDSAAFYLSQALLLVPKLARETAMVILRNQGEYLIAQGKQAQGIAYYMQALHMADTSTSTSPRELGILHLQFAQALHQAHKPRQALDYLQCALMDLVPQFSATAWETNPDSSLWNAEPWLFSVFHHKAGCLAEIGSLRDAFACYRLGFSYLDYLRKGFNTSGSRSFIAGFAFPFYEDAIRLALETHRSTGDAQYLDLAFRFIEQSKTNEILESLQEMDANFKVDPAKLDKYRYQKAEIARLGESAASNGTELTRLIRSQDSLYPELYPNAAKLQRQSLLTPRQIQAELDGGEVFLEYFLGDSTLYIFAIDSSHSMCYMSPINEKFDVAMDKLMLSLSSTPGNTFNSWKRFAPYAEWLYDQLIGPVVRGRFRSRPPKKLIIIPDGRLALLPFECLLTMHREGYDPDVFMTASYLGRYCAVRYGQSASTLGAQKKQFDDRPLNGVLALVASPDGLPKLLHARKEALNAKEAISESRLLEKGEANVQQLLALAPRYRILHLACHAFADTSRSMHSWFALEQRGRKIDSLFSYTIFGKRLSAEMVVLSACGTGKGKVQTGEGVMSLARSFQAAGCLTAVMSLWNLDDESTALLMREFYEGIAAGRSASEALLLARNAYLAHPDLLDDPRKAHPHYWAAMVAVGREGPHLPQYEVNWRGWIIWGAILAVIIALLQRRRRRRRRRQ